MSVLSSTIRPALDFVEAAVVIAALTDIMVPMVAVRSLVQFHLSLLALLL